MGVFSAIDQLRPASLSRLASVGVFLVLPLALARPSTGNAAPPAKASLVASASVASEANSGRFESFAAEMPSRTVAGFRMEGAPQVEVVFGDITHFKRHINRFAELHTRMGEERARFAKATHSAQRALMAAVRRRGCPVDLVAQNYAEASESGLIFRRLGAEFEGTYFAIRDLDELGESSGLTPDYRWQVKNSKRKYRQALSDLREMRSVFTRQLEAELRAHGCDNQALLTRASVLSEEAQEKAAALARADAAAEIARSLTIKRGRAKEQPQEIVRASTATFFVGNKECKDTLRVLVDNTLLGEVAPGTRAAFQSLAGRHSICLLGADSTSTCGETGTVRNAFVHDGFAISRHCE